MDDVARLLRGAGLKVTATRSAVLEVLERTPHSDAERLFRSVRETLPGTSLQAMYAVVGSLTAAGVLRRIEPAGSPARYELRVGDNHHHVVCSRCGAIADVDCVHGDAPCVTPSSTSGFEMTATEITFWGICPACQSPVAQSPGAQSPASRRVAL